MQAKPDAQIKQRNYNLEIMRVIACSFVLFIHVSNIYARAFPGIEDSSYIFAVIVDTITRIGVPIFFMITGSLVVKSEPNIKKNLHRTLKFAIILAAWTTIYIVWNYFYLDRSYDFFDILYEPAKRHLWYLYALIGVYIALPLIQTLFRNVSKQVEKYFVIAWVIYLVADYFLGLAGIRIKYEIPIISFAYYLGLFIIGHLIDKYVDSFKVKNWHLILVAILSFSAITAMTLVDSFSHGAHIDKYFQYSDPFYSFAAIALFTLIYRKRDRTLKKSKTFVMGVAKVSLGIYLIQIIFLDILRTNYDMLSVNSLIGIPIFFVIVFVCSFVAAFILKKIPLVKEIV